MDRCDIMIFVWLLVPALFTLAIDARSRREYGRAAAFTYLAILGTLWFLGDMMLIAGKQ